MKITFLGTGTSQGVPVIGCDCAVCLSSDPRDSRLRCSALFEESGFRLLIDTGPDFRYQMLRAKVPSIDAILMTHFHNDHIAGLDDIRPFNFTQGQSIKVFADELTHAALEKKYDYVFEKKPYPGAPKVDLFLHEFKTRQLGPFTVTPFKVFHGRLPITAYRINDVLYITDAKTIPPQAYDLFEGVKLLILNALRHEEHHSHFNLQQAVEFAKEIEVDRAYFLHISHYMGLHREVQEDLPSNIFLSYDTLEVDV